MRRLPAHPHDMVHSPGYHPASVQVALLPFDLDTLEHFICLERPESARLQDAPGVAAGPEFVRLTEHTVLMPSAPGYQTIGEFHEMLTQGFEDVSSAMGEAALLIGRADAATALGRRLGPLGYLARELAADVPGLLRRLTPAERR